MTRRLLATTALVLALTAGTTVSAHPTATSFVIVTVTESRTAVVDITSDALSLILKLEALDGGITSTSSLSPAARRARINELMPALLTRVALVCNTEPLTLTPDSIVVPPGATEDRVRVRLTTTLPEGARMLSWQSSLFLGSYPVLIRGGDPAAATDADAYVWVNGSEPSPARQLSDLNVRGPWLERFARTVGIGFTHILPGGLDHVLFVCGLFLLGRGMRSLLWQISAFTVAHSVTLALAALGVVSVPSAIVEPLIALSIAYVAIENVVASSLSRWRLAIVFGFGLLHGLGFASALKDLGVSPGDLPLTLVGFNVGVELGQIAVVVLAAAIVRLLPVPADRRRQWITVPASLAIAAIGIFWVIQRALALAH